MLGAGTAGAKWRPEAFLLFVLVLANLVMWPSVQSLARYWWDILDYQHGSLIALLSVVWIGRELWHGAARNPQPSLTGTLLLAPALLAWIVADRGSINTVHQLLWPALLGLAVWAAAGPAAARRLAPAIGLLYVAVPVWDYGLPVLQHLSIFCSEHILGWLGVPATVSEFRVTIPEGTFAIIEGCSGKRFFVVTLAVAYFAVAINHLRGWRAILFVTFSLGLSMVMNWLRIVIVIYAGHVSNMQHYLVANEHKSLGNAMFVVLIAVVLGIAWWLARPYANPAPAGVDLPARPASTLRMPGRLALLPVALLILAAMVDKWSATVPTAAVLGPLPVATSRWQGPIPPQTGWKPSYAAVDAERRAVYASGAGNVEFYINLYTNQENGRELIHYSNNLVAPASWTQPWSNADEALVGASGWSARRMRGPDQRTWLLAHTYFVRGHLFRSELAAKLAYGWYSLTGRAPSGVLAVAAACDDGICDKARMLVADFWENMQLPIQATLPPGDHREP